MATILIDKDVLVPMRKGVRLVTDRSEGSRSWEHWWGAPDVPLRHAYRLCGLRGSPHP